MKIAVHITHESVRKIGGIGAVLSGVCNLQKYKDFYQTTVFYGPAIDSPSDTLGHVGRSGRVLFSSHDNYDAGGYTAAMDDIIKKYNIDIIYGKRELVSEFNITKHTTVEVINVSISKMNEQEVTKFKYALWSKFGIESDQYKDDWDYEQYLRIAIPFLEILEKLYGDKAVYYLFAHEYMGVASVLSALMAGKKHRTVFVAHEVATARSLVEKHTGHDISFYNILAKAGQHKGLEEVFGDQAHSSRNELVKRTVKFDHIFAVGDHVKDEYLFLVGETAADKVKVVYNAAPARKISFEQKQQSCERIKEYTETLFNFRPDAIFTHVTRLIVSKGLWRDIAMLYYLDEIFDSHKLKGVYVLLSTLMTICRTPEEILSMEAEYGWPVLHKEGWPDLIGAEKEIYNYLQLFNARSKAIKGVFINQFGFGRTSCGKRVPQQTGLEDLRLASDAEFGLSVYEPFGIAQIETIPFGGTSVLSSSCGAARFLKENFRDAAVKPFYILDFIATGKKLSCNCLRNLTINQRNDMENRLLSKHAERIFNFLPLTDNKRKRYFLNAQKHASRISWEASAQSYVLSSNPPI